MEQSGKNINTHGVQELSFAAEFERYNVLLIVAVDRVQDTHRVWCTAQSCQGGYNSSSCFQSRSWFVAF